jgi:hypothetical protein
VSLITDIIKRVAALVENRKTANIPGEFLAYRDPYPTPEYVHPDELSQEQIQLICEYCNPKPRLTLSEIEELIQAYRFKLPQEVYDLYQMGNGGLPIGISDEKNWDSVYNYFNFPSAEKSLWTLSNSMDAYCNLLIEDNPKLLPLCMYGEEATLFVLGGEEMKETAPLVWTYDDCINDDVSKMEVIWPSLTNMMLAYAERLESLSDGGWTDERERKIYQRYSNGTETGWYKFCR